MRGSWKLLGTLILAPLLAAWGTSSGGAPNFTSSHNPTSPSVPQAGSGTTQLTLTPQQGFTGTVNLSLVGAPSGVGLPPSSVSVSGPNPVNQTLTVNVTSSVPSGTHNLQVQATSGSIAKAASLSLTVFAPGVNWTLRASGTSNTLLSVTYGNHTFVAVGEDGTILTSANGGGWTARASGTPNHLRDVTYGNHTFVAVGDLGPDPAPST